MRRTGPVSRERVLLGQLALRVRAGAPADLVEDVGVGRVGGAEIGVGVRQLGFALRAGVLVVEVALVAGNRTARVAHAFKRRQSDTSGSEDPAILEESQ